MRHARLRNILAAGALTGLVLATILAFAWQSAPTDAQPASTEVPTAGTLSAENEQLRQAVNILQQREAAYQSQIEAANQTILQLQAAGGNRFQDDDEHESQWEEHEHEENEFAEHEGRFDDD
jgi:S-adenosylmethionine synthetase